MPLALLFFLRIALAIQGVLHSVAWTVMSDPFVTLWTVACQASSVHEIFPDKKTKVGCHFLLQGIFQTPGSNPSLLQLCGSIQILGVCVFFFSPTPLET